jgi:protein-S-isoprenylcysteine O-methyltransferase Ste14
VRLPRPFSVGNRAAALGGIQVARRIFLKLNFGSLALVAVVMPIFIMQFWALPWSIPRIAGLAIAIPSFLLLALARVQLGRAFSVRAKASTLVTTGLYSRIRNPIYVFGSLAIAGFILWADQPWLLLCFVVLIPLQVYRSREEARVMAEKFGASYLEYKRQTWF